MELQVQDQDHDSVAQDQYRDLSNNESSKNRLQQNSIIVIKQTIILSEKSETSFFENCVYMYNFMSIAVLFVCDHLFCVVE